MESFPSPDFLIHRNGSGEQRYFGLNGRSLVEKVT